MKSLLQRILEFLQKIVESTRTKETEINEKSTLILFSTLHILIDNCPNAIIEELNNLSQFLLDLNRIENINIRITIGMCWNSLLKNNKELIVDIYDHVFSFFIDNFKVENYELNFTSVEFFSFILDENENIIDNEKIQKSFENKLNE